MKNYIMVNNDFYKNSMLINLKLLILFTPLILNKYVGYFRANQIAWLKLFVLIGMTLWALKYLSNKEFTWKRSPLNLPIFLFISVMTLSLVKNYYITMSFSDYLIFLAYFVLYFLIINNIKSESTFHSFILLFFITSSLVSLYTILHYYGFIPYLKEYGLVVSPIGQKNWISNYLTLIFPLMFCYFLLEEIKKKKIIYFLLLSLVYTNLMICQSRGIWISISISLFIGIIIIFKFKLLNLFKKNQKYLILLVIIFTMITFIYSNDSPLSKSPFTVSQIALSTFNKQDTSINNHLLTWKTTLEMMKDEPLLGWGIGSFRINYLNYQAKFLQDNPEYINYWTHSGEAHNEYLQIGAEMGLLGLGTFVLIILIFYNLVLKFFKKERDDKRKIICWGLILGITCFLIHSLFTFPLHVPALGSAFFMIVALAVLYMKNFNLPEWKKKDEEKGNLNRKKIKLNNLRLTILYTVLILIILLLVVDLIVIRPYLAEVYAYQGKVNLGKENYEEALSDFEYAVKLDPYNGRVLLNLGATYYNLGNYEEAKRTLKRSKKYYNDRDIYRDLGLCYMQQENYQEAEEELKYALYIDPKFTEAYFDLGYLYVRKENYEDAIKQWKKILKIYPNFTENYVILTNLGIVYKKKEMINEALKYFIQALQLAPEDSPIIEEIEKEIYNIYRNNLDE